MIQFLTRPFGLGPVMPRIRTQHLAQSEDSSAGDQALAGATGDYSSYFVSGILQNTP